MILDADARRAMIEAIADKAELHEHGDAGYASYSFRKLEGDQIDKAKIVKIIEAMNKEAESD